MKPISITISTRPPISAGEGRSNSSGDARDGETRGATPDEQQEPCRDEHDGAVVAVRRQIEDENEAHRGDCRQRNARDAARDRRVIDTSPTSAPRKISQTAATCDAHRLRLR